MYCLVVKLGDVEGYKKVKEEFNAEFTEHKTMTLVGRIHQSVIRTAIRQIALTYSRIFISDMAVKLQVYLFQMKLISSLFVCSSE